MTAMIDWVTARVPLTHDALINGGAYVTIDAAGEVERQSDRWLPLEGSYSSRLAVRGGLGVLDISGNPSKFLQGHNLFGSADLRSLVPQVLEIVCAQLRITPALSDRLAWRRGRYTVSRVDIARMLDCGSPERVRKVLDVLGTVARTKYQSRAVVGSGTVYIGQKSRRTTLKFYDKHAEITKKGHELCAKLVPERRQQLLGFAVGKLRAELTMRSNEIGDRTVREARWWDAEFCESLLDERLAVLEVSETVRLNEDTIAALPAKLVPIYDAWRAGRDLRALYSRRTFYRYRRQLLDLVGIDIAHVQPRQIVTKTEYVGGFPIAALLRGPGVAVPEWAIGTDLLAS